MNAGGNDLRRQDTALYSQAVYTDAPDFDRDKEIGYETVQLSATGSEITPQIAREIRRRDGTKIALTYSDINRIRKDTESDPSGHEVRWSVGISVSDRCREIPVP